MFMVVSMVAVSDDFHHDPRVDAKGQEQADAGVAQSVQWHLPDALRGAQHGPHAGKVARLQRGSARGSEDVPLRVNGSAGSAAAGLSLPMVFRQRVQRSTGQGHRPGGAAGLGWQFAQLPFDPLHGLLDAQRPSAEVDVVPSQTAHLAAA